MVMVFIWFERRAMGDYAVPPRAQPRRPLRLFQPVADAIKVLLKEDIIPASGRQDRPLAGAVVAFVPVMMVFAVVPFQGGALLADLNIGILYIVAISSVTAVGMFMAGWGSNNKYSLLGAMRQVASVVSYEIPVVLSLIGVVLLAGSLSLNQIVLAQDIPFILLQPLGFLLFFCGALAEINRAPFDLLEADSEIVAGFHTEYSGMKFGLFYLVEYAEALAVSAIVTTLFLGGWRGPLLPRLALVPDQGRRRLLRYRLDTDDRAPRQDRPAHGAGLEVPLPAGADKPARYRRRDIWSGPMFPLAVGTGQFCRYDSPGALWSKLFKLGWGRVKV